MQKYLQKNRPLQVTTSLGEDTLLVTGFRGTEQLSHLFTFELSLIADNSTAIDFSQLVGNDISLGVATPSAGGTSDWRYISGICASFSQGNRNEEFTSYYAEVVPKVWLLTRRCQSRIFQQKSIPEILKEVLKGFDCDFQLHGQYEHREYCVQYRETDFDFVSRLMEEEGIYYFFLHSKSGHKMIIADSSLSHTDVPGLTNARYEVVGGGAPQGDHIFEWRKTQAVRAAKFSLRDHSFQEPTQNLEAKESIMDSVRAGTVTHQLKGQANEPLEIYDFPGGYAVRFDGINPSGGDQPDRLQKILDDNKRTAKLRMEAEAWPSLMIQGTSGCRNFVAGHKFTLDRHFDANGNYVLVAVTHDASLANPYRSGSNGADLTYTNIFTCIPFQLPFRPARRTPKPFVQGVQNALVTGPRGEEIFTDKYGRVKVQFYWDREGKKDANSSCWLRVSTPWAGKGWGSINIPRIDQEVIVAFVEGNPDEPLIIGSVYNRQTMPANTLPDKKVVCGLKSNTHKGKGSNEMSMDDTAGKEKITIHGQYDMNTTVEHDQTTTIKSGKRTLSIQSGTNTETIKSNSSHTVQAGYRKVEVTGGDYSATSTDGAVKLLGNGKGVDITGHSQGVVVTGTGKGITAHGSGGAGVEINGEPNFEAFGKSKASITSPDVDIGDNKILVHGSTSIELVVGGNSIKIDGGGISINGTKVGISGGTINSSASGINEIAGGMVKIN
jgi:type VI secretion system secreted protein VgrG